MQEFWYDIVGYEGVYQYSNFLRIKSLPHITNSKLGAIKKMNGRVLKPVLTVINGKKGYAQVSLSKDGITKVILLHKFFAEMFLPNPQKKEYVNHIDGDKHNYKLNNLEWVTKSEDLQHAYDTKLRTAKSGKNSPLYGKRGLSGSFSGKSKPVLNMATGIFYDSCLDAAVSANIRPNTLSRYLKGVRENKTDFCYI